VTLEFLVLWVRGVMADFEGNYSLAADSEHKMTDYVLFLLETGAAKRRVAELFELEALGSVDDWRIARISRDQSRAARPSPKPKRKLFSEFRSTQGPVRERARTAAPDMESGRMKRDLTVSSFTPVLVISGRRAGCAD
jgi:hypothetical protein